MASGVGVEPKGVADGIGVGLGVVVGGGVGVWVGKPPLPIAVGVAVGLDGTMRARGTQVREKKPSETVRLTGIWGTGIFVTLSVSPVQSRVAPGGKLPGAGNPVVGSLPSAQSTPDLRITVPSATTVKKHDVPPATLSGSRAMEPPHVLSDTMLRLVPSTYFFEARRSNLHAAPITAEVPFDGGNRTWGTSMVPKLCSQRIKRFNG